MRAQSLTTILFYLSLTSMTVVLPSVAFANSPDTDASNSEMAEDDELDIEFMDEAPSPIAEVKESDNLQFRGFIDTRWGTRFDHSDYFDKQTTLAETRLQGNVRYRVNDFKFNVKADLVFDDVIDGTSIDVREAYVELPANDYAQVRIGRQNLMWCMGDLIVTNDIFPKDFIGLSYGPLEH
jgi:hypothetical protein